jgi:hypothetical protein
MPPGRNILSILRDIAADEDLEIEASDPGRCLGKLSKALNKKHGSKAVILADERDAPILDHMAKIKTAMAVN